MTRFTLWLVVMHPEKSVRGKRHLSGAHFEFAVELRQMAIDNLFELDN